jgi:adenosylhomocysteinase
MPYDIANPGLADEGKRRILWAEQDMPVLGIIQERFEKEKPLKGAPMAACLHITAETANLARTLKAGGADLRLCASNPLSTQDDVAASLVRDFGINVYARHGVDTEGYYKHIHACLEHHPILTMDDGCDLVSTLHQEYPDRVGKVKCGMEETTTGVNRLRAMHKDGVLKYPVIAVNDADTKHLFDNRYGTGQSTVDGIIRATDVLLAGKRVVIAGYGWCGRGFALRCRGMGSDVIVTEINPVRALEAIMDGFRVMTMEEAAAIGEVFCTLTGDINVIRLEHFRKMRSGAIVANSGHFNVELDLKSLEAAAEKIEKGVRNHVDTYHLNGKKIHILAEGRLVNLSAAEGHPACVMDMSFAVQALSSEYALSHDLPLGVHPVPADIDGWVARLKLQAMNVKIDSLTKEQETYLSSWDMGT